MKLESMTDSQIRRTAMRDELAQSNEQTANSAAESSAVPTTEATAPSIEVNANGHLLPHNWKGTIALIWGRGKPPPSLRLAQPPSPRSGTSPPPKTRRSCLPQREWAALLPTALLSPFGGVIADRFNRKYVMIAADGIAGAFSLVLACSCWPACCLPGCCCFCSRYARPLKHSTGPH